MANAAFVLFHFRQKGNKMSRQERLWRSLVAGLSYAYLACVLAILAVIQGPGESWWGTSLLLFGPTWLLAAPLGMLAVAWFIVHRGLPLVVVLAVSGLILLGPVIGFNVPWERLVSHNSGGPRIRIITWNVEGDKVGAEQLLKLIQTQRPDIVLLQECTAGVLVAAGAEWQHYENGGMCLLSRLPVRAVADRDRRDVWEKAGSGAIVRYSLEAPFGVFEVTNVHLETPREGFEELLGGALRSGIATLTAKNEQRYHEAALAASWVQAGSSPDRIVAGDFNTPPQSDILDTWVSYTNCYEAAGFGLGYTKHTRKIGVRIDHIWVSSRWRCADITVLSNTGAGSDHLPVLAELEWTGT